jgi:NADPH-dependent curcumin reductase CurA
VDQGFDAAIDYKAGDLRAQLKTHAPNGVDVFFDNVGGDALEAALARLARGGRIVLCGAVSQYNAAAVGADRPTICSCSSRGDR